MKLTTLLLTVICLQVSASAFSQKVTLSVKNASIEKVILEIRAQSGYTFFYNARYLKNAEPVTMNVKESSVEEVLAACFQGQPFTYEVVGSTIVIKPKVESEKMTIAAPVLSTITGRVTDEKNEPLIGVSVKVKGSSTSTVTDVDGEYVINAPAGSTTLVFSYLGYSPQEVDIQNRSNVDVVLSPSNQALEEIVIVGYGTQRKISVVGAVDQINAEAFEGRPSTSVTQALQGVSANLTVQQKSFEPGAGVNLNIRGISTLGNNSPLVVIDGIIGGDINLLNPADIESISVLKDAGSAAIYGSRANNGVVLVTTKKGKKNSRPVVDYNGLAGVNSPHFFLNPVKGYENAMLRNESAFNAGLGSAIYTPEQIRQFKEEGDHEWFAKEIVKTAWQQNHNVAVSGGGENSTYLVSVGFMDQRSNFVGPDKGLRRYNYRLNMTNEYGRFKLTSMLSYARREVTDHASSTGTLMADASRVPLYYAQKDSLGRYLTNDVLQEFNSLGVLEKGGFRKYDDDNVFGSLTAELALTNDLKVRGVFGGMFYSNHQFSRTFQVDYFPKGISGADRSTYDVSQKGLDLNTQLMMEYSKRLNDRHDVNLLVGASNENHSDRGTGIYKKFTDPELGTPITETIIETTSYNSNERSSENSLNSLFGRASYSYDDKYFSEFNFRYDGSSRFRKNNRWGFFPSISLGYRLTEEDFMSEYKERVGSVKVRGSYGVLGNQNVGNYQYQTTYFTFQDAYGFNNSAVGGTGYNFSNADIRWERAATFNIGADLDFFKGALTLSLDYFNKVTSDILVPPAVPGVFGTNLPDFNAGKVENKGWEVSASYRHRGERFSHMVSFNLADTRNKVLSFEGNERLTGLEELQILLKEGYPFNSYVGLKTDGYFQSIDEVANGPKPEGLALQPGDNRYVDVNGDGIIDDDDLVVFGSPFPRLTFGATYNIGYKGFDVNLFLQGVGNRTMMIRGETVEPFHYNYGMTMYEHQLDYWTPQNPNARYPRLADNGSPSNTNNYRRGSDMYLYNAAYLRLKNVQLGYTLPLETSKRIGMQKTRIYVSGQNLFTWSKVKFIDPEVTEFNSNLSSDGANSGRNYPTMVYYGFGLDITF